jgi:hypothetical protein
MGSSFLYRSNKLHFGGRLETIGMRSVLEVINQSINRLAAALGTLPRVSESV